MCLFERRRHIVDDVRNFSRKAHDLTEVVPDPLVVDPHHVAQRGRLSILAFIGGSLLGLGVVTPIYPDEGPLPRVPFGDPKDVAQASLGVEAVEFHRLDQQTGRKGRAGPTCPRAA
jgi:hypothetical protein